MNMANRDPWEGKADNAQPEQAYVCPTEFKGQSCPLVTVMYSREAESGT